MQMDICALLSLIRCLEHEKGAAVCEGSVQGRAEAAREPVLSAALAMPRCIKCENSAVVIDNQVPYCATHDRRQPLATATLSAAQLRWLAGEFRFLDDLAPTAYRGKLARDFDSIAARIDGDGK